MDRYFGRVSSKGDVLSACFATVTGPTEEAYQAPDFDEYVLVVEGAVTIKHPDGISRVEAGKAIFLPKGLRVKWIWEGPCKYVPICLPAFSPENCNREPEEGAAKTEEAMFKLRQLHYSSEFPCLFHVARKSLWEACKETGDQYFPPTYEQDGFTHATADPSKLLDVLNYFYKDVKEDFVCLRFTQDTLKQQGIETTFEQTAPVGDTPAIDMGDRLFPHVSLTVKCD